MIVKDWCLYCGECSGVCPKNLIDVRETSLIIDDEGCKECNTCIDVCPISALEKS